MTPKPLRPFRRASCSNASARTGRNSPQAQAHLARVAGFLASAALALLLTLLVLAPASAKPANARPGLSRVFATYNIAFNGISIGSFQFRSNISGRSYELSANARISLLKGVLFDWKGRTESAGRVTARGPRPRSYRFSFDAGKQRGRVELKFRGRNIDNVVIDPPRGASNKRIPVHTRDLHGVVDPLSAVMLLSRVNLPARGADACNQRMQIFDGKMRYDLSLSLKGRRMLDNGDGYKGPAYVCRVKYRPIAGHRQGKKATDYMARSNDIEVWLVPAPEARLYVPYYILLPLPVGHASMRSEQFIVETAASGRKTIIGH